MTTQSLDLSSDLVFPSILMFSRKIVFHPARKPSSIVFSSGFPDFKIVTLNPTSDLIGITSVVKKSEAAQVLNHDSDLKPSFAITIQRIGAGLENLGNTCYLNSVLQCLTHTEPLVAYLQSGKHETTCRIVGFCALCAIQKHVSRALQATGRILAPKDLVSNLRCISRNFRNSRQEDAHEYMVNLLESMHKCCLPSRVSSESASSYDNSLVHKIFGGHLRSRVKCKQCFYCSDKFDPFLDLSLEILNASSVSRALEHFTAEEQLDGGEKQYQCQKCRQKVSALKKLTVHKAPYVLAVHLKRFTSLGFCQKIDKKVQFEPKLDLHKFVSEPDDVGTLMYTLYGVLVHAGGSTHSGHYYCFVRTATGIWHSLDDKKVIQVSEKAVLDQKAYMLFYVRDKKKKLTSKIPFSVQKEISNFMGPKACISSSIAVKVENGSVMKKESAPNVPTMSNTPVLKNDHILKSSLSETMLNPVKELSFLKPTVSETTSCADSTEVNRFNCVRRSIKGDPCTKINGFNDTRSSDNPASEKISQVECITSEVAAIDPVKEKTDVHIMGSDNIDAVQLSSSPIIEHGYSNVKHVKKDRKSIKKVLKYKVASLRLGSTMFIQKRKKQKKNKCRPRDTGDIYKETLVDVNDLGLSTFEKVNKTDFVRERLKSGSEKANCNDSKDSSNVKHIDGTYKSDGNKQPQKRQQDAGERNVSMHNTFIQPIVLGFEDTVVSRWDEKEIHLPAQILESNNVGMSIGHIGDEWDEEYDRGKRKKIRGSKMNFEGPNPFQQIANKKVSKKLNKSRPRSSSSNRPRPN